MNDKDFEIDVQDTENKSSNNVQLPLNFLAFGEIENDDVKVYIKQDVYKALEKFASSDTSKELGSILIGEYSEELGKTNVIISDYIEAKFTDASASTLTFTHETWDYVHREHENKYPEKKIIGWQHTHPNYGIFLSNYDMFIQENFFNMPFQIAYVIDPIQNIRGFFQWKNGKIEKLKGYYIYDDIGKPIKIEQIKIDKQSTVHTAPSKWLYAAIVLLCVFCIGLCGSLISLKNDYRERLDKQEEIVGDINKILDEQKAVINEQNELINEQGVLLDEQNSVIEEQGNAISTLQGYFVAGILDSTSKTTAEDLISKIENHEIVLDNQEQLLSELKGYLDDISKEENEVSFVVYTVESGDSLSSICAKMNISYKANYRIILSMNGIDDPNKIFVGQNLLLPIATE